MIKKYTLLIASRAYLLQGEDDDSDLPTVEFEKRRPKEIPTEPHTSRAAEIPPELREDDPTSEAKCGSKEVNQRETSIWLICEQTRAQTRETTRVWHIQIKLS